MNYQVLFISKLYIFETMQLKNQVLFENIITI